MPGSLTGPYARYTTVVLGTVAGDQCHHRPEPDSASPSPAANEKWVGGIVGLITGVVSAATGVQVIPSVPFMQAIGMEKDELVQALGVFFTVATLALAFNLTVIRSTTAVTALPGAVAMVASFTGMFIGQAVRSRMQPDVFRRWLRIAHDLVGVRSGRQRAAQSSRLRACDELIFRRPLQRASSIATRKPR